MNFEPQNYDWSGLKGKSAEEATAKIKADMPGANVVVLPEGSPTTRDLRFDRVWVFVDAEQRVVN